MHLAKVPSTPADQSEGVLHGIDEVCRIAGRAPADVATVLHGTTVATNTVLTGTGARVGLLVTQGFRYLLHLARSWTPGPLFGWMIYEKPDPIAAVEDTLEVPERMDARGRRAHAARPRGAGRGGHPAARRRRRRADPLLPQLVRQPGPRAGGRAASARRAARTCRSRISSDVLHEFREYERAIDDGHERVRAARACAATSTALRRPDGRRASCGRRLSGRALRRRADAHRRGVRDARCTRCSRAPRAASTAPRSSRGAPAIDRVLTFDMGGTSTDVVGLPRRPGRTITRETQVGAFPVRAPAVDVETIGAGGGSIASISDGHRRAARRAAAARAPARARVLRPGRHGGRRSPTPTSCSATCRRGCSAAP